MISRSFRFLCFTVSTLLSSALLCYASTSASAGPLAGDFVAMCGDSITAQKLYTLYVEDYLVLCRPQADLQAMQFGWGGEKAPSFLDRMNNDILSFRPNIVTLCYGMNDGGYAACTPKTVDNYRVALEGIVAGLKKKGVRQIIIGTPGAVDTDSFKKLDPSVYNNTLAELGKAAKEVAEKESLGFADIHTVMLDAMTKAKAKYGKRYFVAGNDGIHPNCNGHLVMAYAFLKAMGFDGDIGTITLDVESGKAEASGGHKVLGAGKDFVEIESSRYPFCFTGKPQQQDANIGMTEFIPFNEDLNRFKLIVKNASGKNLKVTWGEKTKVFTTEDLQQGINLAAEFPENPFSKPFADAEAKIREKQFEESPLSKELLHALPQWGTTFPDEAETFRKLSDKVIDRASSLRQRTSQILVPVKHKITVESVLTDRAGHDAETSHK